MGWTDASLCLAKARYFLSMARKEESRPDADSERLPFAANFDAAIVFGRSVTFLLQSQLANRTGFDQWYADVQENLKNDPPCKFLVNQRNYILKQGSIKTPMTIAITVSVAAVGSLTVRPTVIRSLPWYRRSLRTIWEDLACPVRQYLHERRQLRQSRAVQPAQATNTSDATHTYFFDDDAWKAEPALTLVERYLDRLGAVVEEAERMFPEDGPTSE